MYKLIVESFDNREDLNAFAMWLEEKMSAGKVKFEVNEDETIVVDFDGYDAHQESTTQLVMNIITYEEEEDED